MRFLAPGIILLSLLAQGEEEKAGLDWWSLQVVERPPVPALQGQDGLAQIDAFVRERLVKNGLLPASRADPGVLIRRLHHDLTGIPPTAQEVSSFVSKQSEGLMPSWLTNFCPRTYLENDGLGTGLMLCAMPKPMVTSVML